MLWLEFWPGPQVPAGVWPLDLVNAMDLLFGDDKEKKIVTIQ